LKEKVIYQLKPKELALARVWTMARVKEEASDDQGDLL
jgi:hypothetical protein